MAGEKKKRCFVVLLSQRRPEPRRRHRLSASRSGPEDRVGCIDFLAQIQYVYLLSKSRRTSCCGPEKTFFLWLPDLKESILGQRNSQAPSWHSPVAERNALRSAPPPRRLCLFPAGKLLRFLPVHCVGRCIKSGRYFPLLCLLPAGGSLFHTGILSGFPGG